MSKYRKLKDWEPIITKLFDAGLTDEEMSEQLGLSVVTVENYRTRFGLYRWYGWLNALGYSVSSDERALVDGTHECFMEE